MKYNIVTIGSAVKDSFWEIKFPLISWPRTPLKKAMVIPFGEKFYLSGIRDALGGNAANTAVTFARQGFSTAIFARVGDDLSGNIIYQKLQREKVKTSFLSRSSGENTAQSILLLQGGERSILTYRGASEKISLPNELEKKINADWLYVSLSGKSYKLFPQLVSCAKRRGIQIAFNPSDQHLREGRKQLLAHLKDVSFLVLNEGEAAQLTSLSFSQPRNVFRKLDALVPGIVAVTSGKKGVSVSDGKYLYRAGTFSEKKVIDRTGAGDAFGSGFVAGLMRNKKRTANGEWSKSSICHAIRLGSANATSVVEHIGATEGILTKNEFEKGKRWGKLKVTVARI